MTDFHGKKLQALNSLAQGESITATAEHLDIAPVTLHRWLREPEYSEALAQRRRAIRAALDARLAGVADELLDIALDVARGNKANAIQLRAALALLERLDKSDIADLAQRLDQLECQASQPSQPEPED